MRSIMSLLLSLLLAPAFLSAAQTGPGLSSSFLQLSGGSVGGQEPDMVPVPEAVPADDGFEKMFGAGGQTCCKSGEECARVKTEGLRAIGADSPDLGAALAAFRTMTKSRWYVTFPDGKPLTDGSVGSMFITRKSFIGSYLFDLKSMSVNISWNPDPSVNLPKGGVLTQKISKVCFSRDRVTVVAGLGTIGIGPEPLSVQIQPSPNSGTDVPVVRKGYLLLSEYGQYLFSSDGK